MRRLIFFFLTVLITAHHSIAQWVCCDTVSFETPSTSIILDTNNVGSWQIGAPHKTFFNSAQDGSKAIVTDTLGNYPPNDTSIFLYTIPSRFVQTCNTCLSFWHKYDMDSIGDGGIIEASYDGGNSWLLLKDTFTFDFNLPFVFYWNSDYHESSGTYTPHELVTSGHSDGWIQSRFCWQWIIYAKSDTIIAPPDSLILRFTFVSDSILKNKEGWMIDEIIINADDPVQCIGGLNEFPKGKNISVYPNPTTTTFSVRLPSTFSNPEKLEIFNNIGQMVGRFNRVENVDISGFPGGLYFVVVTNQEGERMSGRIIKE